MKTKLILFVAIFMFVFVVRCQGQQQIEEFDQTFNPVSLKESVISIPDSVATPEQLVLKRKIENMILVIQVDNNRLVPVEKDYFVDNDIPIRYMDLINENIKETNAALGKWEAEGSDMDISTAAEAGKVAYKAYLEALDEN